MLGNGPPFWPTLFPPEAVNKASPTKMEVIIAPPRPLNGVSQKPCSEASRVNGKQPKSPPGAAAKRFRLELSWIRLADLSRSLRSIEKAPLKMKLMRITPILS
jgi:hypothetical protein